MTTDFLLPLHPLMVGDFSGEGTVGAEDLNAFGMNFGIVHAFGLQYVPVWGDLNQDGDVDGGDLTAIAQDMNRGDCPACP